MKFKELLTLFIGLMVFTSVGAFPTKGGKLLQGYKKTIIGNETTRDSHVPKQNKAIIVSASKTSSPIEWEGEQLGSGDNGIVTFALSVGVSNVLPGRQSPDFNLYVENEKVITFNVLSEAAWKVKGEKQSELAFEQYTRDSRENRYGYMYLTIPAKYLPKGKPIKFKIESTPAESGEWFVLFTSEIENSFVAESTPTVLRDSKKQVVKVYYSHFGKPASVELKLGDIKEKKQARFGINNFEIAVDPVSTTNNKEVSITNHLGTISETVKLDPIKNWQVNFVQHTHTDIGYTRPQHEILSEHMRFIDYALDYCDLTDNYPEDSKFRWTCETAWSVSEYLRTRPKSQIDRLKQRIKEGRIEVTAMYFNYDEYPAEQDLAYSLYPLKEFKDNGIEVKSAMQNDVNGIGWNFSELFPDLGVKYVIMGTHGHKALISFPMPTAFWWESPSGKKTLTYRAEHYNYGNFLQVEKGDFAVFEKKMLDYLKDLEAKQYPHKIASVQYSGYFTDNSPPSTAGSDMLRKWNEKYEYPKLRMAVASEFMETIEKEYGNELQTYRAAWPDWWTDGFGSAAREGAIYRYAQSDIVSNQISLALAKVLGSEIPSSLGREIDEANKALLFYGEHTFGFHASVNDPFGKETMEQRSHKGAYAWESYRRTRPIGETALGLLQAYAPRSKDNASIVIYNPLNWEHSGITTVYADHEVLPINRKTIIKDENGVEVKKQVIRSYADASYWALWIDKAPALGSKYYTIYVTNEAPESHVTNNDLVQTIENQWYRIKLDTQKGIVSEWFDKELGKNLIADNSKWKMGELIYERDDKRGSLDQFKPGNFTRFSPTDIKYEGFQEGDIWDSYKFVGTSPAGMGTDNFTFEIKLYKTTKQVNFTYRLKKKQETEPESVYVSFPFELDNGKIFFDVPGGTIEAGVEQIPGSTNDWNTVQNFASVRNSNSQIVLGSKEIPLMQFGNINLGRFKAEATPETNHIFTWPMNNYWVTNFNADQHGEFEWTYYLTSSDDSSIEFATKFGWDNRLPIPNRVIPSGVSNDNKPVKGSILSLKPSNVLLVNMYPVIGENSIILHLREIGGQESTLDISSQFVPNLRVVECNVLGEEQNTGSSVGIKAWENKFVKIKL